MKELKNLYAQWGNFAADKERAALDRDEKKALLRASITALREQHKAISTDFDERWKGRKAELRRALDNAAIEAMEVYTAGHILSELGSRNTMWLHSLKQSSGVVGTPKKLSEHPAVADVSWRYSSHMGVSGVLRSDDGKLTKFWDTLAGDKFFIVDMAGTFISGDAGFYGGYPKSEIARLTDLLTSILDGSFTGKLRPLDNVTFDH